MFLGGKTGGLMSALYQNFENTLKKIENGQTELLSIMDMAFEQVVREGTEEEVSQSVQVMENFLITHLCDIDENSVSAA